MGMISVEGVMCPRLVRRTGLVCATVIFFALSAGPVAAQHSYASKERTHAAVAHYARARAMLVEALEEFEQGRRYAKPDLLLDAEEFRLTLISLGEQLNRVIDPKPRVTRAGVRFQANPRMVRRERDRLPPVPDGIQDSNAYGEQQRSRELEGARASMFKDDGSAPAGEQPAEGEAPADGATPQGEAQPADGAAPAIAESADQQAPPAGEEQPGTGTEPAAEEAQLEPQGGEAPAEQPAEQAAQEPAVVEDTSGLPAKQVSPAELIEEEAAAPAAGGAGVPAAGEPAPAGQAPSGVVEEEQSNLKKDTEDASSMQKTIEERLKRLQAKSPEGEEAGAQPAAAPGDGGPEQEEEAE